MGGLGESNMTRYFPSQPFPCINVLFIANTALEALTKELHQSYSSTDSGKLTRDLMEEARI